MRNGYGVCRGDEMLAMFIFGEEPPPVDYGPLTTTGKALWLRLNYYASKMRGHR